MQVVTDLLCGCSRPANGAWSWGSRDRRTPSRIYKKAGEPSGAGRTVLLAFDQPELRVRPRHQEFQFETLLVAILVQSTDANNKHDQHGQIRYNVRMRTVNISDLKAQLSAHIQFVKDGEEVLICDRNKPVARIVPCRLNTHSEQEQRLVARGVLLPPLNRRRPAVSVPEPPGDISDDVMEQVWREERRGR
jgi:prevent-host-death family protein